MITQMYRIICGDARKSQRQLAPNSVHLAVGSPPYYGLRVYLDDPDEIGREDTLQQWVDNLVAVYRETWRVLRDDGTLWINCGDSYVNGKGQAGGVDPKQRARRHGLRPQDGAIQGYKRKDLLGLPWRLAFALQADGWYWRSTITWAKGIDWTDSEREAQETIRAALALVRQRAAGSLFGLDKATDTAISRAEKAVDRLVQSGSVMPDSTRDRPTVAAEVVLVMAKSERYFWDRDAIKVASSANTHSRGNGHTPKEHAEDEPYRARANSSFHEATKQVLPTRNARNVWRIPVENHGTFILSDGTEVAHFAAFPTALAERAIKAGTSQAGVCARCGAPFVRVTKPTPEYAQLLGQDWADYEQDEKEGRGHSVSNQRTTKRGKSATSSYETTGWAPTCRCYGEPVARDTICPDCGGDGLERETRAANTDSSYEEGTTANRLALLRQTARAAGGEYDGSFAGVETGHPCPVCLYPDCHGTGIEHAYSRGNNEYRVAVNSEKPQCDYDGKDFAGPQPTGSPCPTCHGQGATGRVNTDIWPAEVLEAWPLVPATVLDMFAGSGTTGRAALNLDRQAVLIDLSQVYCRLARERLAAWPGDVREKRNGKKKKVLEVEASPQLEFDM